MAGKGKKAKTEAQRAKRAAKRKRQRAKRKAAGRPKRNLPKRVRASRRNVGVALKQKRTNILSLMPAKTLDSKQTMRFMRQLLIPEGLDPVGIPDGCDVRTTVLVERFRVQIQADTSGMACVSFKPSATNFLAYNNTTPAGTPGDLHFDTDVSSGLVTTMSSNFNRVRLVSGSLIVQDSSALATLSGKFYGVRFARDFAGAGTNIQALTSIATFTAQTNCLEAPINNPMNCGARLTWFPSQLSNNTYMTGTTPTSSLTSLSWVTPTSSGNNNEGFVIVTAGALNSSGVGATFEVTVHATWECEINTTTRGVFSESNTRGDISMLQQAMEVASRELPKMGLIECTAAREAMRIRAYGKSNPFTQTVSPAASVAMFAHRVKQVLNEVDLISMMQAVPLTPVEEENLSKLMEWSRVYRDHQADIEKETEVSHVLRKLEELKSRLKIAIPAPSQSSISSPFTVRSNGSTPNLVQRWDNAMHQVLAERKI